MDNYCESSDGVLYLTDGFSGVLRWDGSTAAMETAGLVAPTATPTLTGSGSGSIVGEYYAYLRFVDRLGGYVSNLSPISTLYAAVGTTGTITDASNASPMVITSVGHGLSAGDTVKIDGIGGNTAANDTWVVTVIDGDTFSLDDSHADGDYDGGGTWQSGVDTLTFGNLEIPSDPKVVRRQILRNTDGQADTFYVDLDTSDLTSTSLTSTKSDSELSAQEAQAILDSDGLPLANLHYPPPNNKVAIAGHLDRMFMAGQYDESRGAVKVTAGSATVYGVGTDWVGDLAGRFIYVVGAVESYEIESVNVATQALTLTASYTDATDLFALYAIRPAPAERRMVQYTPAGLPESWPPTYAFPVQETGDEITGLMVKGPFIYILERRHIHKFTFQDDPAKDGGLFMAASRGCINQRCWVLVDNDAYMLDEYGVHKFTGGAEVEPLSTQIQEMFRHNSLYPFHINWKASRWFFATLYRPQETIRWFVALSGSYIPTTAICYNYRLNRWWTESYRFGVGAAVAGRMTGLPYTFFGMEHKKVCAFWEGTTDIADPVKGTVRGTATSAGLLTVVDSTATFASSGVVNSPITIIDGTGKGQIRRVISISGTTVAVDMPWTVALDTTSVYQIGGINWNYKTAWLRYAPTDEHADRSIEVLFEATSSPCTMDLRTRHDFGSPDTQRQGMTVSQGAGVRSNPGKTDLSIDMTRDTGIIQHALPGHKATMLHGKRYLQLELAGTTNKDLVAIFQVTIAGASSLAQLEGQ